MIILAALPWSVSRGSAICCIGHHFGAILIARSASLQARIDAWNQVDGCELPIYEPGLEEVVQAARGRNLFFSSDTHKHVAEGDIIFVRWSHRTGPGLDAGRLSLCVPST